MAPPVPIGRPNQELSRIHPHLVREKNLEEVPSRFDLYPETNSIVGIVYALSAEDPFSQHAHAPSGVILPVETKGECVHWVDVLYTRIPEYCRYNAQCDSIMD